MDERNPYQQALSKMTDEELREFGESFNMELKRRRRPLETLEQHTRDHLVSPGLCDADDCE